MDILSKCLDLLFQFGSFRVWRDILLALHGCGCVVTEELVLPVIQRRPRHAKLLSHRLRFSFSHAQCDDRGLLHRGRQRLGAPSAFIVAAKQRP